METLLVGLFAYVLVLWPLVAASRRVLGVRVGYVRALCAAVFGGVVGGLVVRTFPLTVQTSAGAAVGLLIPLAGGTLAATLLFLFVAELAAPSGTALGLFAHLRSVRARAARARRYSRITRVAIRHGLGGYLTGRREPGLGPGRHAKLARSLRRALEEGGVTFVKLGQLLSTRSDLLPPAFVDELSRLQDRVAPAPAEAVFALLREELGAESAVVFAEFDPEPLAAASIAQVYGARLRSGAEVVVKVQRPGIRAQAERDVDIVRRLAALLDERADWAHALGVVDLAAGFADALAEELDFRVEAANLEAVAARPVAGLTLPTVHKHGPRNACS